MNERERLIEILSRKVHPREGIDPAVVVADYLLDNDIVPVVHGWWLTWEEQFPGRTPRKKSMLGVFCSTCHNHADNMSDYCPNCGAKMDLEENK